MWSGSGRCSLTVSPGRLMKTESPRRLSTLTCSARCCPPMWSMAMKPMHLLLVRFQHGFGDFDEEGNINHSRTNAAGQGRFHSDWCSMLYSLLLLSRNLLSDDCAIFISIDDNEVDNLKKICSEVFGDSNYVVTFPWRK